MKIHQLHTNPLTYSLTSSAAQSGSMTVAAALAELKKNPSARVNVSDSSANIAKNLDALKLLIDKVSSISQTGTPAPLVISATSALNNTAVLTKINNPYTLSITGTVDQVSQLSSDAHVINIQINDSSSNVNSSIDSLNAVKSKIKSIVLSDNNNLTLTADQYIANATVISKISSANKINLSNVAVSQVNGVLANSKVSSISVVDNSSNVSKGLDALQKIAAKLSSVSISGSNDDLSLTAKQLVSDAKVLGKITNGYHLAVSAALVSEALQANNNQHLKSIEIVDSSLNISKNIDALNNLSSKLSAISLVGNATTLALTVTQMDANSSVLNKISNMYKVSVSGSVDQINKIITNSKVSAVTIIDSRSNIQSNLNILNSNIEKISSIALMDKSPIFNLTSTNLDSYINLLNKINTKFSIGVTGVEQKNISKYSSNTRISSIAVVGASYSQLPTLLKNSKISSIAVVDATVTQAISAQNNSKVTEIGIKDSSYNLTQNITRITGSAKVKSLQLTDTATSKIEVKDFSTYKIGAPITNRNLMQLASISNESPINKSYFKFSDAISTAAPSGATLGYFDTAIIPSSGYPVIAAGNMDLSVFIYQAYEKWGATTIDSNGAAKTIIPDTNLPYGGPGYGTGSVTEAYVDTNNNIYIGFDAPKAGNFGVRKYSADGDLLWTANTDPNWVTGLTVDDEGNVYTNTNWGGVNKYNGTDGTLMWSKPGPIGEGWKGQSLSFNNGTVYAVEGQTGRTPVTLYAFSKDGDLLWKSAVTSDVQSSQGIATVGDGSVAIFQSSNDKNITFLDKNGNVRKEVAFNSWTGKSWRLGPVSWQDLTRFSVYEGPDNTFIASGLGAKFDEWLPAAEGQNGGQATLYMFVSQYSALGDEIASAIIPISPGSAGVLHSQTTVDAQGNICLMGITAGDNFYGSSPSPNQEYFFKITVNQASLTPAIELKANDYIQGSDLLSTLNNTAEINVSDVLVSQAESFDSEENVSRIKLKDTAKNVLDNLDGLSSMDKLIDINLSDSNSIKITSAIKSKYSNVLAKLSGNVTINVED